eukprot:2255762-Pyramimonas_sp.AAC.2
MGDVKGYVCPLYSSHSHIGPDRPIVRTDEHAPKGLSWGPPPPRARFPPFCGASAARRCTTESFRSVRTTKHNESPAA